MIFLLHTNDLVLSFSFLPEKRNNFGNLLWIPFTVFLLIFSIIVFVKCNIVILDGRYLLCLDWRVNTSRIKTSLRRSALRKSLSVSICDVRAFFFVLKFNIGFFCSFVEWFFISIKLLNTLMSTIRFRIINLMNKLIVEVYTMQFLSPFLTERIPLLDDLGDNLRFSHCWVLMLVLIVFLPWKLSVDLI